MLTFYHSFQQFAQAGIGSVLEKQVTRMSWHAVGVGTLALIVLIIIASFTRERYPKLNKPLYIMILISVIVPTLTLVGSTIYLNSQSYQGGPVHWHADFEIWKCGEEIELIDPKGLSNKIGTNVLHEHSDKRIHLEGVVLESNDASLGKFFKVIGGSLFNSRLIVPIENGVAVLENGACENQPESQLQIFVYKTDDKGYYKQEKLINPQAYIISPYGSVPRGDCVIAELDVYKDRTDKMCQSYQAAIQAGKLKGERE